MNKTEEKLAEIISKNELAMAAMLMYEIMKDCVAADIVTTPDNIYREVDRLVAAWDCQH